MLALPTNNLPVFKLGTAFDLPAPIIIIEPAELSDLVTFAIFCKAEDSPVGAVFTNPPAVVSTNNSSPSAKVEVLMPDNIPKLITSIGLPELAVCPATPNAGILAESSASARLTIVVLPLIPEM